MIIRGHTINPGYAEGEAIVSKTPFAFGGEFDPSTGKVRAPNHELFGQILAKKIFIFPTGKGSSGAPGSTWEAMKIGNNPGAIICIEAEPVLAAAAITGNIPMVDKLEMNPLDVIQTGDYIRVNATEGTVEIINTSISR